MDPRRTRGRIGAADKPQSLVMLKELTPNQLHRLEREMNAQELANKFRQRLSAAILEKEKQWVIAAENKEKRTADIEHCKRALEREVIPFLEELKHHLGEAQFSFALQ